MRTSLIALASLTAISFAATEVTAQAKADGKNIVEVAASAGTFKTLITAAKAAGLVDTLTGNGPLTVFAPTDEAFAKLPEGTVEALLKDTDKLAAILKYHVVPGRVPSSALKASQLAETAMGQAVWVQKTDAKVTVDNATVVTADIQASNGVIHVIDSVILPRENIVAVAKGAGTFKTLLKAAVEAGIAPVLTEGGPFTVFAPNDDAFAKLPAGTIEALLKDKEQLAAILKYHVIPGRVLSTDIPASKNGKPSVEPATLQGQKLSITASKAGVTVDSAKVIAADILAGNGVIHVIDSVVLPASND